MIRDHYLKIRSSDIKTVLITRCSNFSERCGTILKRSEFPTIGMRKKVIFTVLLLAFCFTVSGFTEDVKLHRGEEISLNDYRFSYEEVNSENYFEIGVDEGDTVNILEQVPEDEILDEDRRSFQVDDDLSLDITEVSSDSQGLFLNLSLTAPGDIFADAELDSSAPRRVFVGQGEEVTVPLTLRNTGIVNQTFNLSAVQNSSASVSFNYQDFNISKLQVDAGEEEAISAEFDVPETTGAGTYDIRFVAEDRSEVVESTTIEIRESSSEEERKRIDLSSRESYVGLKPGESTEISVRVQSRGSGVLDNVELEVNSPEDWSTEVSRREVPALQQFESFRSIITVEAPANAEQGDKFLELSASSDETSTEEPERIRLTVQQQSNLRYIGLGIMVLSLGGLVAVYRKLGRR
jgi:uncharacterized membrane protein